MITTVNSLSALTAVLKVAQSGDTIQLASGAYGRLGLNDFHFATDVIITSETPGAPASITGLSITNSNGLTFRDLDFIADPAGGSTPLQVASSQDVHFDHVHVHGSLDGNPANDVNGLLIRNSSTVTVTNSEFEQLVWGLQHTDSNNVNISGNRFHDLRSDGVRGGGSSQVTISGNTFTDFFPIAGDHADAIQFWTAGTTASASDLVISDNIFVRGKGVVAQGVFMRDEVGGLPFVRVTITGNLISGGLYNGIGIDGGVDVLIKDNVVQGYIDNKSWITANNVQGLQVINNAASPLNLGAGLTSLINSGNTDIPLASDAGVAVNALWNASHGLALPAASYVAPGANSLVSISLAGDAADNVLLGGGGNDTLAGNAGNDTISDPGGSNYLRGGDGADLISGGAGFDDMNGNAGADTLRGGAGDDWVAGGKDNDLLYGGAGGDVVYGNLGDDTCVGDTGNDLIRGGQNNDVLKGDEGDDWLSGDKGDDTITGGTGADTFHSWGDAGIDRVTDFNRAQGDKVLLDLGSAYTVSQVGSDTVIDIVGGAQMILVGVSMSSLTGAWLVLG